MLDVYPAREQARTFRCQRPRVAEAAVDAAPGKPIYWLPDRESAAAVMRRADWARETL